MAFIPRDKMFDIKSAILHPAIHYNKVLPFENRQWKLQLQCIFIAKNYQIPAQSIAVNCTRMI